MLKPYLRLFFVIALAACEATPATQEPRSVLGDGPNKPEFVRLSWNDDPSTTAAVVWHTQNQVDGAAVEFGATSGLGQSAPAETYEISGFDGFYHKAKMSGLTPGSTVHYRVGSKSGVSETFTFQTAPAKEAGETITFVMQGDSRADGVFGVGLGYEKLIAQMEKEAPAFILDSGDYTYSSLPEEWIDWQSVGEPVNSSIPRLTTFGNHELIELNYFDLMALPEDHEERWYSLDYGPIHIVCLYTGFGNLDDATAAWLAQDLAATDAKWKVAFFHMPPYNAGNHGTSEKGMETADEVRAQWVPLFEKHGVDLVVGGHDHNYQNFGFLKGGAAHGDRELPLEGDGSAPLYLISGGAGAPLYSVREDSRDYPLLVNSEKAENYILATVDGATMTLEVKRLDGTVIETITINK